MWASMNGFRRGFLVSFIAVSGVVLTFYGGFTNSPQSIYGGLGMLLAAGFGASSPGGSE